MKRVGVPLLVLLVAAWSMPRTLGDERGSGRGANSLSAPRSRAPSARAISSSPRPPAEDRLEALIDSLAGVAAHEGVLPAPRAVKRWERVEGLPSKIAVFDTVFWEPLDTRSLRQMIAARSAVRGKTVLEIGTGSGLLALCCLQAGATKVVATDVNPAAVANAAYNARLFGVADRLEVRQVPLQRPEAYSVVGPSERFDLILSNPPWENGRPESIDKHAYFDPDFRLLRSMLEGLEDHLNPGGAGVVSYGSVDAIRTLQRLAPQFGLAARAWDDRSLQALPEVFLPGMLIEIVPTPTPGSDPVFGFREGSVGRTSDR